MRMFVVLVPTLHFLEKIKIPIHTTTPSFSQQHQFYLYWIRLFTYMLIYVNIPDNYYMLYFANMLILWLYNTFICIIMCHYTYMFEKRNIFFRNLWPLLLCFYSSVWQKLSCNWIIIFSPFTRIKPSTLDYKVEYMNILVQGGK